MNKKIILLFIIIFSSLGLTNNYSSENTDVKLLSNYGSHLSEPFDMKHHVTTYLDTAAGYLYIAGDNRSYNLGDNTQTNSSLYFPAFKNGDSDDKFINPLDWDFEIYHSAIVDNDGSLWTCGQGTSLMLGSGSSTEVKQFTKVDVPNDKKVIKVCATRGYTTIIKLEDNTVWTIGNTTTTGIAGSSSGWVQVDTQLPDDDNDIVEFQGGYSTSLYLTRKGNLYSVGTTSVGGGTGSFTIPKLTNVCSIDLMYQSSYALKNDGTIWTTGANSSGQLGLGNNSDKSVFTQANLTLLDNEFPILVKGSFNTGYFLTNLGNMYIAGSDSYGQYGDGSSNSTNSTFKLIHQDVAYFDVGEYQTGVLFKDSSLKFFGQNTLGQLGIGTTTNVHDAYSDEAKLVSPLAEDLGSGLIPAVTLATYTPDISLWPSECTQDLTNEQILEYTDQTVPIRPGQEHDDGSSNTFIADDGAVYIFSSPAIINKNDDVIDTYVFNSGEWIRVFYNELNLTTGVLKGYTVNITIESEDLSYKSSFNYDTEQENLENYPIQVGNYTVTTTLISNNNEIKTTTETSYSITNTLYTPSLIDNNLKDTLESLYIIRDYNNIDDFNSVILNGITTGNFISGSFIQVENNKYVDGKFSDLTINEISIEYYKGNSSITEITDSGDFSVRVKIEPFGYTSEYLVINFTIDESKVLVHNELLIDDLISFGDSYTIDTNNSILSDVQVLYIQFKNENGIIIEFEATLENINNFNLYPKEASNYIVSSIIKEEDEIISVKETSYTINKLNATLSNDSENYIQEENFTIDDIINHYSNNKLTINNEVVTTTLIVSSNVYEAIDNTYTYVIHNSKNEVVTSIDKTDTYTIYISLDNENYEVNTLNFSFNIEIASNFNPIIIIIPLIILLIVIIVIYIRKKYN